MANISKLKVNGTTYDITADVPGTMKMFAGNTIPAGWLLCDGSAVSRTNYAKLFSAIGTTWGAGDGSTTFNLPNSIGRFAEGASTSGSYKRAGLPNLDGSFATNASTTTHTGVFFAIPGGENNYTSSLGTTAMNKVGFQASHQNSIYGNSTTVQPASFTVKYIIKY